jgi:2'-hydroxyisoflavone reductase
MKRRDLVRNAGIAGILSALPMGSLVMGKEQEKLNVLFMGGTGFIGPHMVRAIAALGHKVTLFNRGKSNPDLFSELELIKGDRLSDDILQLANRRWDIIVDTSCYVPRAVNLLLDTVSHEHLQQYIFISTISVYLDYSVPGITENSPLQTMDDPTSEDVNMHYGALKVLCEKAAEKALPGKLTIIRPGIIIGPGDRSDRFTYWPETVYRGGEVLAPGQGDDAFQTLDARDLANWVALCLRNRVLGTYNATNTAGANSFRDVLETSRQELNPKATITWVPHKFLLSQDLQQMADLPFWATPDGTYAGIFLVNSEAASAAGLRHRPLQDSIRDTHAWFQSQPEERQKLQAGMSAEREAEVLAAWHKQ